MFKKNIFSLLLIALIAISSIGVCSAQGMNWITADNHKSIGVIANQWTQYCVDQYDYNTGERIAHVGYTSLNKWYDLKPKLSNIHFKQKSIVLVGFIPVPCTIGEFNLKNYQYDPLYIHCEVIGNYDAYDYWIEYHNCKTKTYRDPKKVTIDLWKLKCGQPYD